jgi:hypothetical protein
VQLLARQEISLVFASKRGISSAGARPETRPAPAAPRKADLRVENESANVHRAQQIDFHTTVAVNATMDARCAE